MLMFVCREYLFVSSMFFCWQCLLLELLPGLDANFGLVVGSVCLSVVRLLVGSVCCKSSSLDLMLMFVCWQFLFVNSMSVGQQCLL
jgi:hypothetical protein